MQNLSTIAHAIFGDANKTAHGDDALMALISALHDISPGSPKSAYRQISQRQKIDLASKVYTMAGKIVRDANQSDLDEKFATLKTIFAREIKLISPTSRTDRRQPPQIPHGLQIHGHR